MTPRQQLLAVLLGMSVMTSQAVPAMIAPAMAQTSNFSIEQRLAAAERYTDQRAYQSAIALYQEVLEQIKNSQNLKLKRRVLHLLGNNYRYAGANAEAISYLKQALVLEQQLPNPLLEGLTLRSIGLSYRNQQEYDAALDYFEQARIAFAQQTDRYWQMNSLYDLGNVHRLRGAYQQALTAHQQALPIAHAIQRRRSEAMLLYRIAQSQQDLKQYQLALKHYQASIPLLRQVNYQTDAINAYIQLGQVYGTLGQSEAAITSFTSALDLARSKKHPVQELRALFNFGRFYNRLRLPNQAQSYLEQALTRARAMQNPYYEQLMLGELGSVALAAGRYAEAIAGLQQSLKLAQETQNAVAIQNNTANLGNAYYAIGDYRQAAKYYTQALRLARSTNDRAGEGRALGNIAILYRATGNYDQALQYSQASLEVAQELNEPRELATVLLNLGLLHSSMGQIDRAIVSYNGALELAQQNQDRAMIGKLYGNLGSLYERQGNHIKAAKLMRLSIAIAETRGDLRERGVGLSNLGTILIGLQQYDAAEQHLRASIAIWDQQRAELNRNQQYQTADRQKINLFERQAKSYQHLQLALVAQDQPEAALEVAEQARTRALVELMARKKTGANLRDFELAPIDIAQIKQLARDQQATIVEYSILRNWVESQIPQSPHRILRETDLLIWVVQPTGQVDLRKVDLRPFQHAPQGAITALIRRSREAIGVRSRGDRTRSNQATDETANLEQPKTSTAELSKILIDPIQDLLPRDASQHVIFIPQDFLFTVPFYGLQDKQGRHLIEKHTIRIAPSIQVLGLTQPNRNPNRNQALFNNALIVGNPTMPTIVDEGGKFTETLLPLPNAEVEARQVAQLANTNALIGPQATKATVLTQMRDAKLIHLATHGLLDDFKDLGIPGAIALAPDDTGKPNDGILTTDELTDEWLKLQAELVVLSACNTGRGAIKGDGVIGLSRAFLAAGVPSLVVSLWAVDDASTALLMAEFYRNLKINPDRSAALRQAMLKTREQYPEVYHWAAFSLVGQG